eukprot:13695591-Ditylum_brightwellii.AAC.1
MEGCCYCCGKKGNKSPQSSKKNIILQEEWAIHKVQLTQQSVESSTDSNKSSNTLSGKNKSGGHIGCARMHCLFAQGESLKDTILLNSNSNQNLWCNQDYVTNIRDSNEVLEITTNGGMIESNQISDVPYLGTH